MKIIHRVAELRDVVRSKRASGARVGLVPTMGAFHDGHLTLMRHAREQTGLVIVSLFVNPTQFDDPADLARYPRDQRRDAELAASAGVDVLFAPPVDEVYPPGFATNVTVAGLSEPLEGASRGAAHFRGVATVVAKLLNMVQPDVAYFGQKDAQQALIVRRLARDLDFPVRIDIRPTVRESDGLAMSSRNVRLDADARRRAAALSHALRAVEARVAEGERDVRRALAAADAVLADAAIEPEYLAAVSPESLEPVSTIDGETLVAIAARVGGVRLIDNVLLTPAHAAAPQ
ncbi:MAG TPA: pantoate--beta-alanine ligase [Nannocystaceae bacterium]|jgi:pantoate--beta-alanine ligase|nr:pantoate--beta-alanine ligase [Nannocystaceae bacterium]